MILVILVIKFTKVGNVPAVSENNNASTTVTNIPGTGLSVENNGGNYTITEVPVEGSKSVPIPNLNRPIVFNPALNLSDEAKKILTNNINNLQTNLKNDPKNIGNWILLGTDYKITGDYVGAALYWKYASDVSNDYVSLGNLGNIYAYYLKDNGLAETYYKKAIARGPKVSYLYVQLSSVYKEVFNDSIKAKAILDEGLKNIPNDPSLTEAKNNLNG